MARDDIPTLSRLAGRNHMRELREDPLGLLRRFNRECGDLGRLRFFGLSFLIVNTPDLAGELLVDRAASFRKSRFIRTILHPLVGEGLFTSEGGLWRRQRRLMAPVFHAGRMPGFGPVMTSAAARCVSSWGDGDVVDVAREMTRITMAVAARALFDADTFDEADDLGDALTIALEWSAEAAASIEIGLQVQLAGAVAWLAGAVTPRAWHPGVERAVGKLDRPILFPTARNRRLRRAIELLDARVQRMIDERRASPGGRADLLTRLLEARDEEGGAMSDRQLRDEILTLFVAGHETTATALSWALYLLGRHPEIHRAVEAEVAALGGREPTAADLPRLALVGRVFQEALRLYPPVPIYERQAGEAVELGGRRIGKGSYVAVFPWALHHRPEVWPDPERFDPARFAPGADETRHRHAWLPFGSGPRVCIGNHFALLEGTLVLAAIVQRARLELVDQSEVVVDPKAATLRPLGGIRMRVLLRPGAGTPEAPRAASG